MRRSGTLLENTLLENTLLENILLENALSESTLLENTFSENTLFGNTLSNFWVRSRLLTTPIKCLNGKTSLGLPVKGVLKGR